MVEERQKLDISRQRCENIDTGLFTKGVNEL